MPNSSPWPNPDAVIVGDSFGVAAGVVQPEGLQAILARETGLSIGNVSVPSIGPTKEAYLLQRVALDRTPNSIIWLFFGGNDVQDEEHLQKQLRDKKVMYSDLHSDSDYPAIFTLDLVWNFISHRKAKHKARYKKHFRFHTSKGEDYPVWFYPAYLRGLTKSKRDWEESSGWSSCKQTLAQVASELKEREVRLLVVYVPSKPQVYLKHVDADPALFSQMANFKTKNTKDSSLTWNTAIENADQLEHLLKQFADD